VLFDQHHFNRFSSLTPMIRFPSPGSGNLQDCERRELLAELLQRRELLAELPQRRASPPTRYLHTLNVQISLINYFSNPLFHLRSRNFARSSLGSRSQVIVVDLRGYNTHPMTRSQRMRCRQEKRSRYGSRSSGLLLETFPTSLFTR